MPKPEEKPDGDVASTEGDELEGGGEPQFSPEATKAIQEKEDALKAERAKWEQEKTMMNMEIEKAKQKKEPEPKVEEVETYTDAELEKLQFDNFPKYQREIERRATEKAKAEILKDPKISGLLQRTERFDELQKQYKTASDMLTKMGRNGENVLKTHEKDIMSKMNEDTNLSVTEATIQVMAEKGELTPGYNPEDHGVDGIGGAKQQDETINDFIKQAYLQSGMKERGVKLEDYAKSYREAEKNQKERG